MICTFTANILIAALYGNTRIGRQMQVVQQASAKQGGAITPIVERHPIRRGGD
jgi:hypothetical protein